MARSRMTRLALAVAGAGGFVVASQTARAELTLLSRPVQVWGSEPVGSSDLSIGSGGSLMLNSGQFDIVINATAGLSANSAALGAFNRAAAQWESYLSDPITVTINADLAPLNPGVLGSTGSVNLSASYTTVRNQMVADASDETDDGIVSYLPTSAQFSVAMPVGFALDGNVQLSKANAKALGFTGLDSLFGVSDGNITFSSSFAFDYDRSNGITPGQHDFEAVAAHEIGHLLGFYSDVDYVDYMRSLNATANNVEPTTLDLFRFDDLTDPDTLAQFTLTARSMVPGNAEHFDQILDLMGGDMEVLMSTGNFTGDGRQASHWKDNLLLGLLDPTLGSGEMSYITTNDLRAFDLIGYETIAVVPEPGTVGVLAIMGTTLIGRRRRRA